MSGVPMRTAALGWTLSMVLLPHGAGQRRSQHCRKMKPSKFQSSAGELVSRVTRYFIIEPLATSSSDFLPARRAKKPTALSRQGRCLGHGSLRHVAVRVGAAARPAVAEAAHEGRDESRLLCGHARLDPAAGSLRPRMQATTAQRLRRDSARFRIFRWASVERKRYSWPLRLRETVQVGDVACARAVVGDTFGVQIEHVLAAELALEHDAAVRAPGGSCRSGKRARDDPAGRVDVNPCRLDTLASGGDQGSYPVWRHRIHAQRRTFHDSCHPHHSCRLRHPG